MHILGSPVVNPVLCCTALVSVGTSYISKSTLLWLLNQVSSHSQLRPKGYLCRKAQTECDIPEFCNGLHGSCPMDIYKKTGNKCGNGKGYCFKGVCPTLNHQCEVIWGYGKCTFSVYASLFNFAYAAQTIKISYFLSVAATKF